MENLKNVKEYFNRIIKAQNFCQLAGTIITGSNGIFFSPVTDLTAKLYKSTFDYFNSDQNSIRFLSSNGEGYIDVFITKRDHSEYLQMNFNMIDNLNIVKFSKFFFDSFFIENIHITGMQGTADGLYTKTEISQFCMDKKIGSDLILTAGPSISDLEKYYALDAAENGWNNQWNGYLKRFETDFAQYIGTKYAIATSSCTGALHIALAALGIGPGDEVIVPDITWVATANAVLYVGAIPVFADVSPTNWCIDPLSIEKLITKRTKAIIPVHLYGHPAEMDVIMDLAKDYNLFVVEDAAPSIGAEYKGRRTGSFGHFAAFSFQGAKLAVTGEGGMLLTNDEDLYKRAYTIWDQGRTPGTFWIETNGLKYKMSNIQAAIGLAQLERNDSMIEAKRRLFCWYKENLENVSGIQIYSETPEAKSIYWMTSIILKDEAKITRDNMIKQLRIRNVDSRPVFPAISQYPIWPVKQDPQPISKFVGERGINLPSGVCLSKAEVDYVCDQIKAILK